LVGVQKQLQSAWILSAISTTSSSKFNLNILNIINHTFCLVGWRRFVSVLSTHQSVSLFHSFDYYNLSFLVESNLHIPTCDIQQKISKAQAKATETLIEELYGTLFIIAFIQ
jgi:hypothetical protein